MIKFSLEKSEQCILLQAMSTSYFPNGFHCLQIGTALVILNRGGPYYYKSGQLLQTRAELLQIGVAIANRDICVTQWGSYWKSG